MELTEMKILGIKFGDIISDEAIEIYFVTGNLDNEDFMLMRSIEMTLCAKEQGFDVWNKKCLKSQQGVMEDSP